MSLLADPAGLAPSSKPTHKCSTCGQEYSRLEFLRRHERKHTETRPFNCPECPKTFARSDVLLRHRRRCHPEEAAAADEARAAQTIYNRTATAKPTPAAKAKARESKRPYTRYKKTDNDPSSSSHLPHTTDQDAYEDGGTSTLPPNISYMRGSPSDTPMLTPFMHASMPLSTSPPSSESPYYNNQSPDLSAPGSSSRTASSAQSSPDNISTLPLLSRTPIDPVLLPAGGVIWGSEPRLIDPLKPDPPRSAAPGFGSWYTFPPIPDNENQAQKEKETSVYGNVDFGLAQASVDGGVSFYPEQNMMSSEFRLMRALAGDPTNETSRFYMPPGAFGGCYQVPHWLLPPLHRLSYFAERTFDNYLAHLGVIHEPTFRLAEAHGTLAFAMCTSAAPNPRKCIFGNGSANGIGLEFAVDDPWHSVQSVVRTEKTNMWVKKFARGTTPVNPVDALAVVQSMLLYHTPSLLSIDHGERVVSELFLGTVIKIGRHSGLFSPKADHAAPYGPPPPYVEGKELEKHWKKWISLESFRRTVWLLYALDTLASLEAGVAPLISPRDVRYVPLPAPMPIWTARTAEQWHEAMTAYQGGLLNLNDAVTQLCHSDTLSGAGQEPMCLLSILEVGPFARLVVILTLLRGIIQFGEGKSKGGFVTQQWIIGPGGYNGPKEKFEEYVLASYSEGFNRWRKGWDFDRLCYATPANKSFETSTKCSDTVFVNDATPYYWLSVMLHDMLQPKGEEAQTQTADVELSEDGEGINRLHGTDFSSLLNVARQFARSGEGVIQRGLNL
ncbi:hypothetical protein BOTBODRAFT_542806 [Botryobasidium botryosum FD-172 SS1]|uniref:C2H2-type domain-containing protein n=1 Tax=Botryobasidium botryosum (strain FD-172 SS1) TaxID=930990 RepID=A0A067N2B2_BOTB1|nr:hypothetical protein BOTBODRAFT_542806 [Botryobasidium botryosum FD-172 SS1]